MINTTELLENIGDNLHTIRSVKKETLQGVAQSIGITHPVLSKIENGRSPNLTLALLIKLCNHYMICSILIGEFKPPPHHAADSQLFKIKEIETRYPPFLEQYQTEIQYLREQNLNLLDILAQNNLK